MGEEEWFNRLGNMAIGFAIAVLFMVLFGVDCAEAETLHGRVTNVIDGDTVVLEVRVRLKGIDAPEKSQDHGLASTEALSSLVLGEKVRVDTSGSDRYGRTVGRLWREETKVYNREHTELGGEKVWFYPTHAINVHERLVLMGAAWINPKYNDDPELERAQKAAQAGKVGLWRNPNPVPPWEYRRR